jgi:threonine/homoserine/homoserine lactone efflux protein
MGTILLSALVAHTAWHWMTDRGRTLAEYDYTLPVLNAAGVATLLRFLMLLVIVIGAVWLLWLGFERMLKQNNEREVVPSPRGLDST